MKKKKEKAVKVRSYLWNSRVWNLWNSESTFMQELSLSLWSMALMVISVHAQEYHFSNPKWLSKVGHLQFGGTLSTRWISDSLGDGWSKDEVLNTLRSKRQWAVAGASPSFLNIGHIFFTIGTYWTQELHPKEASKVKSKVVMATTHTGHLVES